MFKSGGAGKRAFLKSRGATIAIGGVSSVPLYKTIMHLIRQLTGEDPEEYIDKLVPDDADMLRDMIVYGLPAASGFTIGGSIGMELPVFDRIRLNDDILGQVGGNLTEFIGVPWAIMEDAQSAFRAYNSGQKLRSLEYAFPSGIANIFKAARLYNQGQTTISGSPVNIPGKRGPRKLTLKEAIGKGAGFQPVSSTNSWELSQALGDFRQYKLRKQRDLANRIANARNAKDSAELKKLEGEWTAWNIKQIRDGKPEYVITSENLMDSLNSRTRNRQPPVYMRRKVGELMKRRGMLN